MSMNQASISADVFKAVVEVTLMPWCASFTSLDVQVRVQGCRRPYFLIPQPSASNTASLFAEQEPLEYVRHLWVCGLPLFKSPLPLWPHSRWPWPRPWPAAQARRTPQQATRPLCCIASSPQAYAPHRMTQSSALWFPSVCTPPKQHRPRAAPGTSGASHAKKGAGATHTPSL